MSIISRRSYKELLYTLRKVVHYIKCIDILISGNVGLLVVFKLFVATSVPPTVPPKLNILLIVLPVVAVVVCLVIVGVVICVCRRYGLKPHRVCFKNSKDYERTQKYNRICTCRCNNLQLNITSIL